MSKDEIVVDQRELYEAMLKAIKLRGQGRLARKQITGNRRMRCL